MHFIAIPFRNLWRHPLRAALTITGIAVAVGALVALVGVSRGAERAWVDVVVSRGTHLMAFRKGALDFTSVSSDESWGGDIARFPGVVEVSAELLTAADVEDEDSGLVQNIVITGWPEGSFLWDNIEFSEGEMPGGQMRGEAYPMALGRDWAEVLGKRAGDRVRVLGYPCEITGIVDTAGAGNRRMAFMELGVLQEIVREEGSVTNFNLQVVRPEDEVATLALKGELEAAFEHLEFYLAEDLGRNNLVLQFMNTLSWATSGIALVVAFIVIVNTLLMSVTERMREFGIFAATGWSPRRIGALVLIEAFLLSAIGCLCGIAGGWVAMELVARLPFILAIEPEIGSGLLAAVVGVTIVMGLAAGFYPAWVAARQRPVETIGHL